MVLLFRHILINSLGQTQAPDKLSPTSTYCGWNNFYHKSLNAYKGRHSLMLHQKGPRNLQSAPVPFCFFSSHPASFQQSNFSLVPREPRSKICHGDRQERVLRAAKYETFLLSDNCPRHEVNSFQEQLHVGGREQMLSGCAATNFHSDSQRRTGSTRNFTPRSVASCNKQQQQKL